MFLILIRNCVKFLLYIICVFSVIDAFFFSLQLLFFAFVGLSTQAVVLPANNPYQIYDEPEAKNIQLSITKPQKFFWPEKFSNFQLPNFQSWKPFQSWSWPSLPFLPILSQKLQSLKPSFLQHGQITPAGSEAIAAETAFIAAVAQGDEPVEPEAQSAVESVGPIEPVEPVKPEVVNDVSVVSVPPAEVAESRSMRLPVTTRPPGVPHHDDTLGPVEVAPIFDPLVPLPYLSMPILPPSSWLKYFF